MTMQTLLLVTGLLALTICAAVLGWKLGALPKRLATLIASLICLVLVCGAWLAGHPAWLPDWMIVPAIVYLYGCWYAPPAALLFLLAAQQARRRAASSNDAKALPGSSARRQTVLLSALTFFVLVAASNQLLGAPNVDECAPDVGERVDRDDVVRQSTLYTCAGASCATLLRLLKIDPRASEAEMVRLCMTRRFGGATALGMAVGLKAKVEPQGWHVKIVECDWPAFSRLRLPAVCAMRHSPFADHAVVACAVDDERGVQIADPLFGLDWWPADRFKEVFQNEAIVVFRETPTE